VETASGARNDRPKLAKLLAQLKAGDVLVTIKLDRSARSLHHLLTVLKDLDERQIGFETIDGVSTRGSTHRLPLNVLGAVAQFEKEYCCSSAQWPGLRPPDPKAVSRWPPAQTEPRGHHDRPQTHGRRSQGLHSSWRWNAQEERRCRSSSAIITR
jgi:resolvase-like protein